jgi:hypothetical protein
MGSQEPEVDPTLPQGEETEPENPLGPMVDGAESEPDLHRTGRAPAPEPEQGDR